jgi:hypothetical protein
MKNKAFNEFLLSFVLLLTSSLILFIQATLDLELGPVGHGISLVGFGISLVGFGVSFVYAISSMIIAAKQLVKKAGKKGYSIAAVIGGCLLTSFYLLAILEMMFLK